ncbi:hypothetical protein MAM1_0100d05204 [Mucor ambiguus]|uniref:Uncharacterized protein n=1 Tax=Mucor ambiguus TaxID=91626 RepID=A0A0C9LUW4_9FUNG|nr:hypothetical protein MAM1_0100d05204 [Mucor ambiguus]
MKNLKRIISDQRLEINRLNAVVHSLERQIHDLENSLEEQKQTSEANPSLEAQTSNVTEYIEECDASSFLDKLKQQTKFFEHCATNFKRLKDDVKEKEAAFKRTEAEFRQEEEKIKALDLEVAKCCNAAQQISSTILATSLTLDGD